MNYVLNGVFNSMGEVICLCKELIPQEDAEVPQPVPNWCSAEQALSMTFSFLFKLS